MKKILHCRTMLMQKRKFFPLCSLKTEKIVPAVAAIVSVDDFYRSEQRIICRAILELSAQGTPPNILSVFEE